MISDLCIPANMPSPEQMAEVAAAAELLLEAMAKAGNYQVPSNMWHTIKISICRRSDGQLLLSDMAFDRGF